MRVTLHPGAEKDIQEAAEFYEREGSPGLAAKFIREFKRLTALIATHPDIGVPRASGLRSFSMNVFPYTVIYRALGDEIKVLVVKHDKKRPGYGAARS
jgi:toxin ParE1/3/4